MYIHVFEGEERRTPGGERVVGAVYLIDERWQQVGLVLEVLAEPFSAWPRRNSRAAAGRTSSRTVS